MKYFLPLFLFVLTAAIVQAPSSTIECPAIVTGLTAGIYQYELRVTDDKGAIGRDTVTVTVYPAINELKAYGGYILFNSSRPSSGTKSFTIRRTSDNRLMQSGTYVRGTNKIKLLTSLTSGKYKFIAYNTYLFNL